MAVTGELIGQIQHLLYQPKGNAGGFVLHCFKFGYLKSQCTGTFHSCVSFSQSLHSWAMKHNFTSILKKYLTSKLIIFSSLRENQKATNMCFWDLSWCWVEISCVCVHVCVCVGKIQWQLFNELINISPNTMARWCVPAFLWTGRTKQASQLLLTNCNSTFLSMLSAFKPKPTRRWWACQ